MNNKSILVAGAMSLAIVNLASASQDVYMTGSTAARSAIDAAFTTAGAVFQAAAATYTTTPPASGATLVNYTGTLVGDTVPTTVHCFWTGSEGGFSDLVGVPATETFYDDSNTGTTAPHSVDIAMADNEVAYSKLTLAQQNTIEDSKVYVIPFEMVAEKGSSSHLTNCTWNAFYVCEQKFSTTLSLFSGDPADTSSVYVTGRDNNSGTRVNAFGDSGYGITSAAHQSSWTAAGGIVNFSVLNQVLSGFSGGGSVATQLKTDMTGSGISMFGYVGLSDASTAITGGATLMTLNGVPYSTAAVEAGDYCFWGNEYVAQPLAVDGTGTPADNLYQNMTGSGVYSAAPGVASVGTGSTVLLSAMHCTRTGPTGPCTH